MLAAIYFYQDWTVATEGVITILCIVLKFRLIIVNALFLL